MPTKRNTFRKRYDSLFPQNYQLFEAKGLEAGGELAKKLVTALLWMDGLMSANRPS